jgi:hypothetical protein
MGAKAAELELPESPPSIRLSELRELPERELVRRVLGPLEPFPYLTLRDSFDNWALHGPARLWFWSRPRAGGHPGVCQTVRLIVQFEPGLPSSSRDDPALIPGSFDMQRYYIIENREEAFGSYSPKERKSFELDAACKQLDPRRERAVAADSAYQFVKAVELVGLGEHSVGWVKQCDPLRAAPGGCIQIILPDSFVEFDLNTGGNPIRIVFDDIEDTSAIQ